MSFTRKILPRNNMTVVLGFIALYMAVFSVPFVKIARVFGYGGATTATISYTPTTCTAGKPGSAPYILFATPANNSVTLTWTKATNPVTKYLVAYGTTSDAMQYGNPDVGGPDTTFYTVKGLSGGTRYYFKVKAVNGCMPGDFSNVMSAVSTGNVITAPGPAESFVPAAEIPANLFDIVLSLESAVLGKSSDLVARTQFTSFGTVPTLVNMVYTVEDAGGKEVYSEKGEVTVETEQMVTKEFKNLKIGPGKYTLILLTTYGDNVKDEFKQAFEIKMASDTNGELPMIVWFVSISVVVGFVIYLFMKHKRG